MVLSFYISTPNQSLWKLTRHWVWVAARHRLAAPSANIAWVHIRIFWVPIRRYHRNIWYSSVCESAFCEEIVSWAYPKRAQTPAHGRLAALAPTEHRRRLQYPWLWREDRVELDVFPNKKSRKDTIECALLLFGSYLADSRYILLSVSVVGCSLSWPCSLSCCHSCSPLPAGSNWGQRVILISGSTRQARL